LTKKTVSICISTIFIILLTPSTFGQSDPFLPIYVHGSITDADISNNKAAGLIQLGDYEGAMRFLEISLKNNPNHVTAIYNKGLILLETDKHDEVVIWFEENQHVEPKDISALNEIGRILIELQKPEESLVWFDKALETDPKAVYVLYNKGLTLYKLGQYDEAISYYDKALEIDPDYESAIKNKELAKKDKEFFYNDKNAVSETEDIDYDSIRPILYLAIFGVISYAFYYVKKRRQKYIRKTRQIINEPSFSVLKIRWSGSNITYQVIFDKERLLFIRPDKILTDRLNLSLDEIFMMDKLNFEIPFADITKIELKHSTYGVNGVRAGKLIINYKNHDNSFDILPSESFDRCKKLFMQLLPSKLT